MHTGTENGLHQIEAHNIQTTLFILKYFTSNIPTLQVMLGAIDWRYGRGVLDHVAKHKDVGSPYTYQNTCSIQVSRRSVGAHY